MCVGPHVLSPKLLTEFVYILILGATLKVFSRSDINLILYAAHMELPRLSPPWLIKLRSFGL
jgi:hypothetical protein